MLLPSFMNKDNVIAFLYELLLTPHLHNMVVSDKTAIFQFKSQ